MLAGPTLGLSNILLCFLITRHQSFPNLFLKPNTRTSPVTSKVLIFVVSGDHQKHILTLFLPLI